jgi:hypothetical protein
MRTPIDSTPDCFVYNPIVAGGRTKETIVPPPARILSGLRVGPAGFEMTGQCESDGVGACRFVYCSFTRLP